LNFLKVVSRHGRLDCLKAVNRAAHEMYNEMRNRVAVFVRTAAPVTPELLEQIAQRLRTALKRDVEMHASVDPSLIGGLVVRVGDTVYDGSVTNRLRRLRDETVERTAQQIRQALDRFAVEI
jgi:F-type H+-transporting ATPase subunit delta